MTDVPLEDKAKRYSDSQYMSFYSNNIANNKAAKTISSHQGNTIRSNMLSSLKEDKENLHPLQIVGMQKTIESNYVAGES